MPFLQFLPWCSIDEEYEIGEIGLVPFAKDANVSDLGDLGAGHIRTILATYRGIDGQPVNRAALVKYDRRPFLTEVSDREMATTRELVELACFSGLSKRKIFDPLGPYCNSDCFVVYGQKFEGSLSHSGIGHRKRAGELWDFRSLDRTVFSVPLHTSFVKTVTLDSSLIAGLLKFRLDEAARWRRWQNAISCFKQANTDSEAVSSQVEWVLLCAAFERLLEARSDHKEVARVFSEALKPTKSISVGEATRTSNRFKDRSRPLRYEWMKEFYRIRGDFAHGNFATVQPTTWKPLEHIVLASISFPLCVKSLLKERGCYCLTEADQDETDAFEALTNQIGFLDEPPDSHGSMDSWWKRHLTKARRDRRLRTAVAAFEASEKKG